MSPRKLQEQRLQAAMDSRTILKVRSVEVLPGNCLHLSFSDGVEGTANLTELVSTHPAMASLKDPEVFAQAYLDLGAVEWPEVGIATETLYALTVRTP